MELVTRRADRKTPCVLPSLQGFLCELERICAVYEHSLKLAMVEPGIPIIYDFWGLGESHQLSVPLLFFFCIRVEVRVAEVVPEMAHG